MGPLSHSLPTPPSLPRAKLEINHKRGENSLAFRLPLLEEAHQTCRGLGRQDRLTEDRTKSALAALLSQTSHAYL